MRQQVLPAAAAAFLLFHLPALVATAAAQDCEHEKELEATVAAAGASSIRVEAAAGTLRVEGRPGLQAARVRGTACASSAELLEGIDLRAERREDQVQIEARLPDSGGFSLFRWNRYARLDLVVEVPDTIPLTIRDSSGPMDVRAIAAAEIRDSSGHIDVEGVGGDLDIDDSSGGIRVSGVGGNVRIDDSSGEIVVTDARGEVWLRDSSGGIEVRGAGSVVVERDSSGGIDIAEVEGDVLVRHDSSGDIDVRDVGGDFVVERDSSGDVRHRDVRGQVRIPGQR